MLKTLEQIAIVLQPYRRLFIFLALLCLGTLAYQLLLTPAQQQLKSSVDTLSFLALLWLLLLNLVITIFSNTTDETSLKNSFLSGFKRKLKRMGYWLISLLFICLSLAVLIVSIRMLRV